MARSRLHRGGDAHKFVPNLLDHLFAFAEEEKCRYYSYCSMQQGIYNHSIGTAVQSRKQPSLFIV